MILQTDLEIRKLTEKQMGFQMGTQMDCRRVKLKEMQKEILKNLATVRGFQRDFHLEILMAILKEMPMG